MFISRFRFICVLILCLLLGAVIGTVYESLASDDSGKRRVRLSEMVAKLDLSNEQKAQLDTILEQGRKCMVDINTTYRAEFGEVRNTTRAQIREILTPDQRKEFDEMMAEQEARRQHQRKNRTPGNQAE
ncbi:MAG: hypothetical protein OXC45_01905 [Gemmatimonadetes bacterium]|nr:hypothetical protein [Gemmatimonadota bacterium]